MGNVLSVSFSSPVHLCCHWNRSWYSHPKGNHRFLPLLLVVVLAEQRLLFGVVAMSRQANGCAVHVLSENSAIFRALIGLKIVRTTILASLLWVFVFSEVPWGLWMAFNVCQQWHLFSYPKKFKNIAASCVCWLCNAAALGREPKSQWEDVNLLTQRLEEPKGWDWEQRRDNRRNADFCKRR